MARFLVGLDDLNEDHEEENEAGQGAWCLGDAASSPEPKARSCREGGQGERSASETEQASGTPPAGDTGLEAGDAEHRIGAGEKNQVRGKL